MTRSSAWTTSEVPSTSFSPWTRTATRSDRLNTKRMSCSMRSTATPLSRMAKTNSSVARVSWGFMPAVGSSRSSRPGSEARARAISSLRCSPYGRFRARWSRLWARPMNSRSSMARSSLSRSAFLKPGPRSRADHSPSLVRVWRPTRTFSRTVMLANRRMFWKVRAMPACVTRWGLGGRTVPL